MSTTTAHAAGTHAPHRDDVGSKMGMWLFLFTELILFGGLFIVYAVYRFQHPDGFRLGAVELDTLVGTVNTIILLTSSLTIAMSITARQQGRKHLSLALIGTTLVFAAALSAQRACCSSCSPPPSLMFSATKARSTRWCARSESSDRPGAEAGSPAE